MAPKERKGERESKRERAGGKVSEKGRETVSMGVNLGSYIGNP